MQVPLERITHDSLMYLGGLLHYCTMRGKEILPHISLSLKEGSYELLSAFMNWSLSSRPEVFLVR